jgi:HEAT repeat protein
MTASDIQSVIDSIHGGRFSELELMGLLQDPRGLVRANVLMTLPRRQLEDAQLIVDAVVTAASKSSDSSIKLIGTTTQRKLAIATLAWLDVEPAREAYRRLLSELAEGEQQEVVQLVSHGPIE